MVDTGLVATEQGTGTGLEADQTGGDWKWAVG